MQAPRRLVLTAAAIAAAALLPRAAAAQSACDIDPNSYDCRYEDQFEPAECYELTLEQCQTPHILQQCAVWAQSHCDELVNQAYQSQAASMTATRSALNPSSQRLQSVKSIGYDASGDRLAGYQTTYTGKVLNQRFYKKSGSIFDMLTPQERWELNGDRVTSCEEYSYEKYYQWSQFEQAIKDRAGDWYGAFDAMMRDGAALRDGDVGRRERGPWGISLSVLLSRNAPPAGPKNAYFQPAWDGTAAALPHPSGTPYVKQFDPRIAGWLASGGKSWTPPTSWQTLRTQGYAVTTTTVPEQLALEQQKQKDYLALWDERRQYYRDWLTCAFSGPGTPSARCLPGITTQQQAAETYGAILSWIDSDIEAKLLEAQAKGCLSTSLSVCDFDPRPFILRLTQLVRATQEADYQRCVKLSKNNFGASGLFGKVAASGSEDFGVSSPTDYRVSSGMVDILFGKVETWLERAGFKFPTDPVTKKPVLGNLVGDSSEIGGSFLGAKFGYDAGWSASDFAWGRDVWQAQAEAHANAYADARVFGQPVEVFKANAKAWTHGDNQVSIEHSVRVLGQNLYTPVSGTQTLDWNLTIDKGVERNLVSYSTYIVVVCIPIRLDAGVSGALGVDGGIGARLERNPTAKTIDLAARARVTPRARLSAFVAASVSAGIVSVGVGG